MANLTKRQKESLAFAVMSRTADLIEFTDLLPLDLQALSSEDIRKQLAKWMEKLPGDLWDIRLNT